MSRLALRVFFLVCCLTSYASAQDKIFLRQSTTPTVGAITGVDATHVHLTLGSSGSTSLRRADIQRVEIAVPETLAQARHLLEKQDPLAAIKLLTPLQQKYNGLPQDWIEESLLLLVKAHASSKQNKAALDLLETHQKYYPQSKHQEEVSLLKAQALIAQGQSKPAFELLQTMITQGSTQLAVSEEQSKALGQACLLQGKQLLTQQQPLQALDSFLKVIVLYHADAETVAQARLEAAKLYTAQKNPSRARALLEDLLAETPSSKLASEASQVLKNLPPS